MVNLRLLFASLFVWFTLGLSAQVSSVNYQMKYDTTTCLYDCYIIINSGSASTTQQRIQFNSQYSIVTPYGTTISVDTTYMPLIANATYTGTTPQVWDIRSSWDYPAVDPTVTFHSITPDINPIAHYNNVTQGDTIKVFSLSISPTVNCASDIKIFENGVDPSSSDPDMSGLDFSNGFTMGSTTQLYNANSTQIYPPKPLIVDLTYGCTDGIEIDLTASTSGCQLPLTYAWTGPNSYVSSNEDVDITPSTPADNGIYEVVITDAFGCQDSVMINATSKPDAGADKIVCAGTTDTLFGTSPTTGTWSLIGTGATVSNIGGGMALITFSNAASGNYNFKYEIPGCSDTMIVLVNEKPTVSIDGDAFICTSETTTLLPNTGGTWASNSPAVASVNNMGVVTALSSGTATFTFTNSLTGCTNTTPPVTVNPQPTVTNLGSDTICIGNTTNLTPSTGGTWSTSDASIATVTNSGLVTGIAGGTAKLVFNETSTGCNSDTITITVTPRPTTSIVGSDSICVFSTTQMSPSTGGTWVSSAPLVASINNSGLVTGLQPGKAVFTYTASASQCISLPSDTVTVLDKPEVAISGDNRICIDANTTLSPSTGGTWISNNPSVASVTNAGIVTSLMQGTVTFTYTDTVTGCFATTNALIVDPRPTVSVAQANICIGAVTNLSPSSGGVWTNHTPVVASLTGGNNVTGLTSGTAKFTFLEQGTDCISDTVFVTVEPGPTVSITGDDEICVGFTTQLSPSTGGTWQSSDNNIASVSNSGLVTGKQAGIVTFTFTSTTTFCTSEPTDPVTVIARPIINLADTEICVDETTTITPTSGGTWVSNNAGVATVTNAGLITGITPGTTTFVFTNTSTGCVSSPSTPITVNAIPDVEFTGPATICVGSTTNISPVAGGTWVSSDTDVAVVTNSGVVTAVGPGTAYLTYTETSSSCSSETLEVNVTETPVVAITGDTLLCIGETSSLTPNTGGAWTSSNTSVATVTNAGVVTAEGQGSATFTFTSLAGCPSEPTEAIQVNGAPTININGDDEICIGDTSYLSPASEGIWTASSPGIVNILPNGVVVGVAAGTVTFSYVDTLTGCPSDSDSAPLTVNPKPTTNINGPENICVGSTSNISPTTGGTWSSVYDSVAVVNNVGIITGISPGKTPFIFTNSLTGCSSDPSDSITVEPGPTINITGDTEICEGETTTLSPTSGGTWESSDETVATVTDLGVVTGVGAGSATFVFTENGTGCKSEDSDPVIVHGKPTVSVDGSTVICKGGTTNLLPNTGGTWSSSDDAIATVTNSGLVTGVAEGTVTFTFTLDATGCVSEATEPVQVSPAPDAQITGDTEICIGSTTTLSPSVGGTWTSSNPSIATVTNGGIVTAIAPGKVTFNFTETATGCSSESSTGELTISNCTNPDFNSTFVDVPVDGDVSTNDFAAASSTYGPSPVLTSSPVGSVASITMGSDGTYTFEANMVGVYLYNVPVCYPPFLSGCPTTLLTITVVDHLEPDNRPVANTDYGTTNIDTDVTLASLANDRCIVVTGCSLDPGSVIIVNPPANGSASIDLVSGDITYSPNSGYIGKDTLRYRVCVDGEPGNCAEALQIITINDLSADNSTDAADDYAVTPESNPVSGNVKTNDTDAEGDLQTVTAQNVTVAAGTLVLATDGSYTFTPAEEFFGPVDFPYTTCDDNVDIACASATLHILVVPDLSVKVRVYLEGALMANGGAKGTTHTRPLMRDNLRVSPFTGVNYIPSQDPYQVDIIDEGYGPFNYDTGLSSQYDHYGPGDSTMYLTIPDPSTVFAVTGEDAIVDWVFVELRSKIDTTVVATRSGLLHRDGDVVDLNGKRGLRFSGMKMDDYYVSVKHRNHLGVMTNLAQTPKQLTTLVDFTVETTPLYDKGFVDYGAGVSYDFTGLAAKKNASGVYRALWAGDFDGNGKIKASNPGDDLNVVFFDVFSHPDNTSLKANFDFAYGFRAADFDLNSKVKFDNPNDDKNMLFGQLLFYPLNTQFLSNFDFFLEQLPN